MQAKNRLLLVAIVGIWIGWLGQGGLAATANQWLCENKCTGNVECGAVCWRTQFEFDQDYPSTTCGDEEYECCGNGACNPTTEGCNACTDDCGEVPSCPGGGGNGDCDENSDCDAGEVCNSAHECVAAADPVTGVRTPTCGGSCTSNANCCGTDVCLGQTGNMSCGIPSTTYCPGAPACSGFYDSKPYNNCAELGLIKCGVFSMLPSDMYCDPGINRCVFNAGFSCVDSNLANVTCYQQ